jgi:asparagine synthase (glutamine-hydrolysing)
MCGIAGIFHADPERRVDPETLVAMAAIQYHRGPDGFGYRVQDDRGVGFSHARLSIIDLDEDRGRQPFVNGNETIMTAVNGELYDYKRIRADLTLRGVKFRTKSDSEMVMHLYERVGLEDAIPHFRGEFGISLYDREHDRLVLIRDRFGVKPLYFTEANGAFVFGSELKVLFAHPDVPRRFSDTGLFHQLMQTMVPGTTAFEGVQQVKPGHMVIVERAHGKLKIRQEKYWDMDFPLAAERAEHSEEDEEYWIEGVREQLMEAVQLRLEADVPVACYLSGGIDSCITLGLAAATQQSPVKAFTIGFDDVAYDETAIAREMAESVGADHDIMTLQADHLYDNLVETLWHAERTIYNTLGVAKLLMSRHVNQAGYKVVVTGEGSDELFGGYPAFRRDLFLHGLDTMPAAERAVWQQMLSESNKLFSGAMLAENELDDPALTALVGFTPSCLQPWLAAAEHVPGLLSPERRAALEGYAPGAAIAGGPGRRHAGGPASAGQGPVRLDQDHARGPDPDLGRRPRGHGELHGGAPAVPGPPPGRVRRATAAVDADQGPHREIRAARGDEGPAAQGALRTREVRVHGPAGPHRPEEVGRHEGPGGPVPVRGGHPRGGAAGSRGRAAPVRTPRGRGHLGLHPGAARCGDQPHDRRAGAARAFRRRRHPAHRPPQGRGAGLAALGHLTSHWLERARRRGDAVNTSL